VRRQAARTDGMGEARIHRQGTFAMGSGIIYIAYDI
jgi:hypothetical protein